MRAYTSTSSTPATTAWTHSSSPILARIYVIRSLPFFIQSTNEQRRYDFLIISESQKLINIVGCSTKPTTSTLLPISFNIREFLLENGVDLEEMDRFETQQRQADMKNKKHVYFLNVRQLATHFEGEIQKLNLFFTDYRNRLLSILSQQRFSRVIMPEESAMRMERVQFAFNEIVGSDLLALPSQNSTICSSKNYWRVSEKH